MMAEAVVEKLRQLSVEGIWVDIGISAEVENLGSALKQMQSLIKIHKKQRQLLLLHDHDYDHEDNDLVEELVYEADKLVDKIIYRGLQNYVDVGSGGVFECLMGNLLNLFPRICPAPTTRRMRHVKARLLAKKAKAIYHPPPPHPECFMASLLNLFPRFCLPPTEGEEAADLTRRIRHINARLLTKAAKASHQRGAGDVDDNDHSDGDDVRESVLFDDEDDIWNKGDSAVAVDDDFVVGGEGAIEELICGWLVDDDGKYKDYLKIITMCGMGGMGKTTLASKLAYQDYSVRRHFDCIAWANIGKSFRTRPVLEDLLLQHLFQDRDELAPFSDFDLARKLYEFLQPKRYLIVLDDLWSNDAWDCLRIAFPPFETTGSRVLLTTRDTLVPEKIASSFYNMRTLNQDVHQDEHWEFLRRTAVRGDKPLTFYSILHY